MKLSRFEKLALALSGITATAVGGLILAAPQTFYASYGITLGANASLLSELRAPAAGLVTLGLLMLSGLVRQTMVPIAIAAALMVFLAFPAGRLIGVIVDGMPSAGILGALALELAVAAFCLIGFRRRQAGTHSKHNREPTPIA